MAKNEKFKFVKMRAIPKISNFYKACVYSVSAVFLVGFYFSQIFVSYSQSMRYLVQVSPLFVVILLGMGCVYWVRYFMYEHGSNEIYKKIQYFIVNNKFYETTWKETRNFYDGKVKGKKEVISRHAFIGYLDSENVLIVRFVKTGDSWTLKADSLDDRLNGLFNLPLDNKVIEDGYVDYYFKKTKDKRVSVVNGNVKMREKGQRLVNNSVFIPLNNNLSWNVKKQPHGLIAGVTGGGKTTFINYLIIEFLKMKSEVFICDPKHSDLSSLKIYLGDKNVASDVNQIARLSREVKELMLDRFKNYKENPEKFIYGATYDDYGLKPVFLIFDELGAFQAVAEKKVYAETLANLKAIILQGREMGVFCVLSTQQPNANNIPTELRDMLSMRLTLGNMSSEAYSMVFGSGNDFKSITQVGSGYLYLDGLGWEKPKYFESPYLDYKEFDFIEELKSYV